MFLWQDLAVGDLGVVPQEGRHGVDLAEYCLIEPLVVLSRFDAPKNFMTACLRVRLAFWLA